MLDTVQRMSHMVKKAYGGSNLTCGGYTITNNIRHFMIKTCQVNGCAPQLWSTISSIVFSSIQTQCFGIHFVNSFTTKISQLLGFSYVYHCDMIQSDYDIESTHSQMKLKVSEWQSLIRFTGGYLVPDKNVWCLVDYKWILGKRKCTNLGQEKLLEAINKLG